MTLVASYALTSAFWIVLLLIAACMLVIALGPTHFDRLVATDLSLVLIAVELTIYAAIRRTPIYMDAALIIAILSYLVTVVVARMVDKGKVLWF